MVAAPAERRHRQVTPAVPVEVRGLDVRHPRPATERSRRERPAFAAPEPHNSTAVVVGRQKTAEVAHQEVENAITVEIDRLDVRRIRQAGNLHERRCPLYGFAL